MSRKSSKKKANKNQKANKKLELKKEPINKILLVIFLILCVIVFVLATIMITKNAEHKHDKYDMKVPLTKEELKDGVDIKINVDDVSKNQSKEYRVKVTNYLDKKVNDEVLKYQIKTSLPDKKSKIDIEIYNSENNYELLDGKKKVTNLRLPKDKKTEIIYTIKLTQRQNPTKNECVDIQMIENN